MDPMPEASPVLPRGGRGGPARFAISPLRRDEASDYAHLHVELLNTTYAHLVGPDYARRRRAELDARVAELLADLDESEASEAAGRPAFRRHVVAHNQRGGLVGIASSGEGVGAWESTLGDAWFPPSTTFTLDHLYLVPGAQGGGLGQALLDAALPGRCAAYLWVITDNARALGFYARNGFVPDGLQTTTGTAWGHLPMTRLTRSA